MKQRILYLDNLKGIAILLVVLGHCIQFTSIEFDDDFIFRLIYSFHMPLFFMISGYVSCKTMVKWNVIVRRRLYQLILPYILMGGVKCLEYDLPFINLCIEPNNFSWFIWSLFFINLIVVTIDKMFGKKRCFLPIIFTTVLFALWGAAISATNTMGVKQIGVNLQYFVMGYLFRRYELCQYMNWKHLCVTMPLFFVLISFWHRQEIHVLSLQLTGVRANLYRMVTAYIGCYSLWVIFKEYFNRRMFLIPLGTASLGIYLLHFHILDFALLWGIPLFTLFITVTFLSYVAVLLVRKSNYLKPFIGEYINIKN